MARSTQFVGHTDSVDRFLQNCVRCEPIGVVDGMFGEHIHDLSVYVDVFGTEWREFVQDEPWSSGPMIFLGLKSESHVLGWMQKRSEKVMVDRESGQYWI